LKNISDKIGMQCKIRHFYKNGCWWDPWNAGVPLVPQVVIPCFCKILLHKRRTNRGLFTAKLPK